MSKAIQIRMGGYGPPSTGFSKALKFIGDRLTARFSDGVAVDYGTLVDEVISLEAAPSISRQAA